MNRWSWTIGAGLVILLAGNTGADAQQRGMMRGQMQADTASPCPGGMGMMGARPARLLAQRDRLELTDDQVARLEELREDQKRMRQGMHTGMMAVRSRMRDVTEADSLDLGAYRSALEAMADQMVGHRMQWARFEQQVMEVLTPEQRASVQRGAPGPGHMMRGPGMRDG